MEKSKDGKESRRKNRKRSKQDNIRIIVSPVYIGNRPMAEVIGNAVADCLKNGMGKAG